LEKTFRRLLTLLKFQKELVWTWGSSMAAAILGSLWKAEIPVSDLLVSPLEEKVGSTAHTIATISQWNFKSIYSSLHTQLCFLFQVKADTAKMNQSKNQRSQKDHFVFGWIWPWGCCPFPLQLP
jgi:hypothetical protein